MEAVKRRREVSVSVVAFEIFGQGRDLESNEDLSWEDPFDDTESSSGCGLDAMCGQICGSTCLMHRNEKRGKKWAIEKPKLDNTRQLVVSSSMNRG